MNEKQQNINEKRLSQSMKNISKINISPIKNTQNSKSPLRKMTKKMTMIKSSLQFLDEEAIDKINKEIARKSQKKSSQHQLFEKIYQHKYIKSSLNSITQRNKTFANKGKLDSEIDMDFGVPKNKSVGSLLPRLKQLEVIAESDKKTSQPKKRQTLTSLADNLITPLQIYMSKKFINKQDQVKMFFLTSQLQKMGLDSKIPDKMLNEQFSDFIFKSKPSKGKNLRAILQLVQNPNYTQEQRITRLQYQKSQLTDIAKYMIHEHQNVIDKNIVHENQQENIKNKIKFQKQANQNKFNQTKSKEKNIQWVLKQCMKYDRKFKIRKNSRKNLQSKSVPKLVKLHQ